MAKQKTVAKSRSTRSVIKTAPYEPGGKAPATRRRLLDAAALVLAEKGFTGMRLSDVGEVAGVQAPAIYYHFNNKEELASEVFSTALVRSRTTLEEVLSLHENDDALDRLAVAIDAHVRMSARQSVYRRAWMHRSTGDVPASVQQLCLRDERAYARVWSQVLSDAKDGGFLRDDVDLKTAQQMLLGALNSISFISRGGRALDVDEVVRSAQTMLLSGLSATQRDWPRLKENDVEDPFR
jgi:AcrR family transcriptional regulator